MVENLPANARNMGWIPDLEGFRKPQSSEAHVPQPLRLCSRAQGMRLLSPHTATAEVHPPWRPRSATNHPKEKPAHCCYGPCSLQLEGKKKKKACTATNTQHSQKETNKLNKIILKIQCCLYKTTYAAFYATEVK